MSNELIQKAAEALDIALGRTGVFNPPELDFMCAAYDGLVAALQPSLPQDMEPEILSELLDSAMVSTGEIVPDKAALQQDVEEWMAKNKLWSITAREFSITTRSIRAFLAGKVLVPVEPTKEMVVAGHHAAWRRIPSIFDFDDAENVYKAMLTASKGE